jgi:23S rRNA pseudouridine1911/1915/1917 synthase
VPKGKKWARQTVKAIGRKNSSYRPADAPGDIAQARTCRWKGSVETSLPLRADKYIAEVAKVLGRSQIKARNAVLLVNGKAVKFSRKLIQGDLIELSWTEEMVQDLAAEKLDVSILYEDENVFVFDKAQGMVTHPAAGNWRGTLANAALWLDAERRGKGAAPRGGIVHRLDKDTSGVIIVARNAAAHEFLAAQFKNRSTRKEYIAFLRGFPGEESGRIDNFLARDRRDRKKFAQAESGGKRAITDYKVLSRWKLKNACEYSLVALYPRTGRTHQLRVHMAGIGCPVVGDPLYGKKDPCFPEATLMLHARRLRILLPGREEASVFQASLPQRFTAMTALLKTGGRKL